MQTYNFCGEKPACTFCAHVCIYVHCCSLIIIMFPHAEMYSIHYFISSSFKKNNKIRSQQNKMSDIKKDFKQSSIDHSFNFNSEVSSIVDDYLFNEEIAKGGLKRNREPENIVGTKTLKSDPYVTLS